METRKSPHCPRRERCCISIILELKHNKGGGGGGGEEKRKRGRERKMALSLENKYR